MAFFRNSEMELSGLNRRKMDRRKFLGISALGGALAITRSLTAAEPSSNFPTRPRERLAVSTYPFRSIIAPGARAPRASGAAAESSKPRMSLVEFAGSIREQFDVSGIEPWSHHFESVEPDYLRSLASAFQKAGVRVVNIPCDVSVQLCGTPEELMAGLDTYSKWVDAAVILGSPSIRVHVPKTEPLDDVRCPVEGLKAIADYGEKNKIVINLENDEATTESPSHVLKIIEKANTPFLRALPDFGNSRQLGDEQFNEQALQALFAHAFNISHVKEMETIGGKILRTDIAKIFAIAKKAGYRGYFSMEWDADSGDPYQATKKLIEQSLSGLS